MAVIARENASSWLAVAASAPTANADAPSMAGTAELDPAAASEGSWVGTKVSKFNGVESVSVSTVADLARAWAPVPFWEVLVVDFEVVVAGGTLYQLRVYVSEQQDIQDAWKQSHRGDFLTGCSFHFFPGPWNAYRARHRQHDAVSLFIL